MVLDGAVDPNLFALAPALQAPILGRMLGYAPPATMEISNGPSCALWPVLPQGRYVGPFDAKGAPAILVVGTTRDSATPFSGAEALANTLAHGRLLTMVGDGHVAYSHGSPCIDRNVDDYLVGGILPPVGTECAQLPL